MSGRPGRRARVTRPYYVLSPEYPSGGGEFEPPEYGCDCIEVEAKTKREAVRLGTRKLLESHRSWPSTNRRDGSSPFVGMRAELAICGHGYPHFVMVGERAVPVACWGCAEESRRFRAAEEASA